MISPFFVPLFALCLVICVTASPLGHRLGVLDLPDLNRKRHTAPTPLMGGVAVLVPFALWASGTLLFGHPADPVSMKAILLCTFGAALVGFADDQSNTTPLARILSLLTLVAMAFVIDPEFMTHILNWTSLGQVAISSWPYFLLVGIAAVGLVNAVNMADGQNGLVSGMFVIWSTCLSFLHHQEISQIAYILMGLSLIVWIFNLTGRLFLGDCGSYGITFLTGLLVMLGHAKGVLPLETIIVWFFIPVADCLRLIVIRPLSGRSPVTGDRDHLHHKLENALGKWQGLTTYLAMVGCTSLVATLEPQFSLACIAVLAAFYICFTALTYSVDSRNQTGSMIRSWGSDNGLSMIKKVDRRGG